MLVSYHWIATPSSLKTLPSLEYKKGLHAEFRYLNLFAITLSVCICNAYLLEHECPYIDVYVSVSAACLHTLPI